MARPAILVYSIEALLCVFITATLISLELDGTGSAIMLGALVTSLAAWRLGAPRVFRWSSLTRLNFLDAVIAVSLFGLILRLVFILYFTDIPIIWDAALFMRSAIQVHDVICNSLNTCMATGSSLRGLTVSDALSTVLLTRVGLYPAILGFIFTILPANALTGHATNALLDAMVILMTAGIVLRLNAPRWVALAAALIQATYVPGILITGTIGQQPFISGAITASLLGFVTALTSDNKRIQTLGCVTGSACAFLLGYASISTRPLMWLILGLVAIISAINPSLRPMLKNQLASMLAVGVIIAGLWLLLINLQVAAAPSDVASTLLIGLSTSGTISVQTTPLSSQYFWLTDAWPSPGYSFTTSLAGDFSRSPVEFLKWLDYSIVSNWRYPNNGYLQWFLLDLDQLRVQHAIQLLLGIPGLAWLMGQQSRNHSAISNLILTTIGYVVIIYSLVNVEPRRMLAIGPLVSIGAAYGLWMIVSYRQRLWPWVIAFGIVVLTVWLLPLALFLQITSFEAGSGYLILLGLRFMALGLLAASTIVMWKRSSPAFSPWLPSLFLTGILVVAGIGSAIDPDWQTWSASGTQTLRQKVTGIVPAPDSYPWLVVDVASPEEAAALAIRVNGAIVKPAGSPMIVWRAGIPPFAMPNTQLNEVRTIDVTLRSWFATPLPPDITKQDTLTITVEPGQTPVAVFGSYPASSEVSYAGPLLDPWHTGVSFQRGDWNWSDPRVPWPQSLNGVYESAFFDGQGWQAGDLATAPGRQSGLYRVFITQEIFGPNTNALPHDPSLDALLFRCPEDEQAHRITPTSEGLPSICIQKQGRRQLQAEFFNAAGESLGISDTTDYDPGAQRGDVVDSLISPHGKVVIVRVLHTEFVANIFDEDGQLIYSIAFK